MAPRCPPIQRSQAYLVEGDEARDRGDYEEAINKYRAAYYGLPPNQRVSYVGSLSVRNAMEVFGSQFDKEQDPAVLEQQLGLVNEFLVSVEAQDGGRERVGAEIVEILEEARDKAEQTLASLTEPDEPAEPATSPDMDAVDDAQQANQAEDNTSGSEADVVTAGPRRSPNWLGIGLTAGGGLLTGVGAGVLVGWWTVRQQASNYVDLRPGYEEGTEDRENYLDDQRKNAQSFRIAGAVLVSVGLASVTGGVVYLLLGRQQDRRGSETLTMRPSVLPRGAGLLVERRF